MKRKTRKTMGLKTSATLAVLGAAMVLAPAAGSLELSAQHVAQLDREEELRLAMSAGPVKVSQAADVYVFGERGFERAIEGTNGWACLVVRITGDPRQYAPHCLNPAAERTVLPSMLVQAEMQAAGKSADEIAAERTRMWSSGLLPIPDGPAYAFMLSKGQRIGPNAGNFQPHFMLYTPYGTAESAGVDPNAPQFGIVGPGQGNPLSTFVILMDEFVDPAEIDLPGR